MIPNKRKNYIAIAKEYFYSENRLNYIYNKTQINQLYNLNNINCDNCKIICNKHFIFNNDSDFKKIWNNFIDECETTELDMFIQIYLNSNFSNEWQNYYCKMYNPKVSCKQC